MNPFGIQIVSGRADYDHCLCRSQCVIDVWLVIVTLHRIQGFFAEKDVVFSGKFIIDFIAEIGIVRSGILKADKDLTSFGVLFFYLAVFLFVFLDQICRLLVVFHVAAEAGVFDCFFVVFGFLAWLVVDAPEGGNRFSCFVVIKNDVLFAQESAPVGFFHAAFGNALFDHIVVSSSRFVEIRFLSFVDGVN